jgi:hypothetical protein
MLDSNLSQSGTFQERDDDSITCGREQPQPNTLEILP